MIFCKGPLIFTGNCAEHRRTIEQHMKMLTVRCTLTVGVFLLALSCHHSVQPNLSNGAVIEGIQVAGNRTLSTQTILANIQTRTGDRINTAVIKHDITSVRSLGFDDVRVEEENGRAVERSLPFPC